MIILMACGVLVGIIGYIFIGIAAYDYMENKLGWGSYDNVGITFASIGWPLFILYWILIGWPIRGIFWLYKAMTKPVKVKKARRKRSGFPEEVK